MEALFARATELAVAVGVIGAEIGVAGGAELAVAGGAVGVGVVGIEFGVVDDEDTKPCHVHVSSFSVSTTAQATRKILLFLSFLTSVNKMLIDPSNELHQLLELAYDLP